MCRSENAGYHACALWSACSRQGARLVGKDRPSQGALRADRASRARAASTLGASHLMGDPIYWGDRTGANRQPTTNTVHGLPPGTAKNAVTFVGLIVGRVRRMEIKRIPDDPGPGFFGKAYRC